jgi:uncharacterized protein (TIGR02996 family)
MEPEPAFVHAIQSQPENETARLVYADWLEERGDPRAEFLRLDLAIASAKTDNAERRTQRTRLHQMRAGIDPRWLAQVDRPSSAWRIVRTRPTRKTYGKALPAFIHNASYYLGSVDAYADGAVDCWGFVDLSLFRRKVAQGWVATQPPARSQVSVHNLGSMTVSKPCWALTPDDIIEQVEAAISELNPRRKGLIDMHGNDTEERDGIRWAKLGLADERPYRITPTGEEVLGGELPVFLPGADGYRLVRWFVYADGVSQLGFGGKLVPLEVVGQMLEDGTLCTEVPNKSWVTIDGLGRFRATRGFWYVQPSERLREAYDVVTEARGEPGAIYRCREAHAAYETTPSEEHREALRQAYEAVPEHLRVYCGDMDSKDLPIRHILYPDESEE